MRSSPLPTATFAMHLLRAMGLSAVVPLAACGGNVVVDAESNGGGVGGSGGAGGSDGGGDQGGAGGVIPQPCVPDVGDGKKLKHVCLDACPPPGEEKAVLGPLVSSSSCDEWCCSDTWLASIECGPLLENGKCCFDVTLKSQEICMGRPFVADGRAQVAPRAARGDWGDAQVPCVGELDLNTRSALCAAWLRDALYEHASVASFARFTLELLAVGAPPDLVAAAQQAAAEEVAHARVCFGLASAYGAAPVGPGALDTRGGELRASLADVAEAAAREGCVGETLSALAARAALQGASDPAVRAVLSRIADEEEAHAALAWRFVAWALAEGDADTRARVRRALDELEGVPAFDPGEGRGVDPAAWRAHGRLTAAELAEVFRRGLAEVVRPCAAALLNSLSCSEAHRPAAEAQATPRGTATPSSTRSLTSAPLSTST